MKTYTQMRNEKNDQLNAIVMVEKNGVWIPENEILYYQYVGRATRKPKITKSNIPILVGL